MLELFRKFFQKKNKTNKPVSELNIAYKKESQKSSLSLQQKYPNWDSKQSYLYI